MSERLPGDLTVDSPRLDNTPEGGEHCKFCCGNAPGMVVVGTEHTDKKHPHVSGGGCLGCTEQYGPCPACELGKLFEFSKTGRRQWGRDGFWKGMEVSALEALKPTCVCKDEILPNRENQARAQELLATLAASIGGGDPEPDPVQETTDPVRQDQPEDEPEHRPDLPMML